MCEILTNYFDEESGEVCDLFERLQVAAAHAIMYADGCSAYRARKGLLLNSSERSTKYEAKEKGKSV